MSAKVLNTLYPLKLLSKFGEGRVLSTLGCSEVHYEFLGFGGVQIVVETTACQMLNLLSVGCLIIFRYQTFYSDISKFDNCMSGVCWQTVMCEYGVEKGTEDRPLGFACVQDDG